MMIESPWRKWAASGGDGKVKELSLSVIGRTVKEELYTTHHRRKYWKKNLHALYKNKTKTVPYTHKNRRRIIGNRSDRLREMEEERLIEMESKMDITEKQEERWDSDGNKHMPI